MVVSSKQFKIDEENYKKAFPKTLKEKLGALIVDVVERDIPDNAYTTVLCNLFETFSKECAHLNLTEPLWTGWGNRACMLSYIDNLRRDVRHTLKNRLTSLGVISSSDETNEHDLRFSYVPFKFSSTTERPVDLVLPDLHHVLVKLYSVVDPYIPLRRTIQKRVENAFQNSSIFKV